MPTKKYTKCGHNGCRKKALKSGLCEKHVSEPEVIFATDAVVKVTELEAARFAASDAEIRNAQQGMKILELEIAAAERAIQDAALRHKQEQDKRRVQYETLRQHIEAKKAGYITFVTELAQKYQLDPQHMSIDPDSRVVRDLREGTKS